MTAESTGRPARQAAFGAEAGADFDREGRLICADDVAAQRWRNGGGITRELLARPADASWRLRISVAEITQDGDFSAFPGVERWFTVLSGAGVELYGTAGQAPGGDGSVRLRPGDAPLCFDGGSAPRCRLLDGATRDLNLMLRGAVGAMRPVVEGTVWSPPRHAACGLFAAVAGRCAGTAVPAHALLWFDTAPPALVFSAAPLQRGAAAPAALGWWLFASLGAAVS